MISAPDKVCLVSDGPQGEIRTKSFAEDYPLNILIAEDNFVNLKLIERILYKLGYQIDTASDGVQVLNSFSKKEHNVILMDIRMPHMDGFETTQIIRQMTVEQPYIIAMTANAMSNDRAECIQNGMNDYISKPLCINEIINKLKIAALYCTGKK
jgi:CheY-like chemotaxis protein